MASMEAYELNTRGGKILYVDATAEYRRLEGQGVELANVMSARLRAMLEIEQEQVRLLLAAAASQPPPEGPHFVYETGPGLFLGRRGRGPLYVAWDTNLLLDYLEFGSTLWQGDSTADVVREDYAAELEGLQLLLSLLVFRDIRFVVLPDSIDDAKKNLSPERRQKRIRAFGEFTSALRLLGWGDPEADSPSRDGLLILPESELQRALARVPAGFDRRLIEASVRLGAYVFLTRDEKVLRARDVLRPFGLLVATPLDVVEELFGCGAFFCLLEPRYLYWPMPDQQRAGHLISALLPSSGSSLK
jgi:hypothetical protein